MQTPKRLTLAIGLIASILAVGLPYWRIPYRDVSLPHALPTSGLVSTGLAAFAICAFRMSGFWKAVGIIGASVPSAVALRVLAEATADPTSHNLWPIELVIAGFLGVACAGAGASLGVGAARISGASATGSRP
jgi:hypothetical protein